MSAEQQITEIEEEIRKTPYNKATQHHIGLLKAKIARLRDKSESKGGKAGVGYSVRKTGDATVVLVGFPSVGKSTILNKLTNAKSKIGSYAFTTLKVIPGVMLYKHAKIQILDIPGLIKGASSGTGMGKEVLSVVRNADLIVFVTDPFSLQQVTVLQKELYNAGLRLDQSFPNVKIKKKEKGGIDIASTVKLTQLDKRTIENVLRELSFDNAGVVIRENINTDQLIDVIQGNKAYVPSLILINKSDLATRAQLSLIKKQIPEAVLVSAETQNLQALRETVFNRLKLMRIFLKQIGKKADKEEPLIIREHSTINDVCEKLHRDFLKRFKHAKVWGPSSRFPGQILHGSHILKDQDIVQINLK